ncbi:MAG: enolase [Planctomycetota bacterium]|nr:enolase [Planctomycetota bacterium]
MKIKDIEIILLDVPMHEVPDRAMAKTNYGWRIIELCRVTTDNGLTGIGETLPNYTWGKVSKEAIARAKGTNPFELMWDDSLGAGLQMALFDVAGKAAGVPVYRLLGKKHRDWCPISWWGIDMSPEDYASEARDAVKLGYTSFKQKARPWYDVYQQTKLTAAQVGVNFKLDYDFNEHLINAGAAISVLQELDKVPNMALYESPIPQADVEGNRRIRAATRCAIAMHYGNPPIMTCIQEQIADGFVVSGGASSVIRQARLAEQANMPFFLQLVGTGLTTTMMMHQGAVCSHSQWPAITCMNMYVDQLITKPIEVKGGYVRVPETPGLGVELNEAVLKWKVGTSEKPNAEAIYSITRDSGVKTWYHGEYGKFGFWTESHAGNVPHFEHGVKLEQWKNDGSKEWKDLAKRTKEDGPVME